MSSVKKGNNDLFVKLSIDQISKILDKGDVNELKIALKILKEATNLSSEELLNILIEKRKGIDVPISIFRNRNLGVLQILVKYLKENLSLNFSSISKLLKRDQRTIWSSYNVGKKKFPDKIEPDVKDIHIPLEKFSDRNLSTLEILIDFLSSLNLKNYEISNIVNRDQRTIWTILKRIKEKKIVKKL